MSSDLLWLFSFYENLEIRELYPNLKIYFKLASKLKPCTWCRYKQKITYIGRLKAASMNNHSFRSIYSIRHLTKYLQFQFPPFFVSTVISLLFIYYLQFRGELIVSDIIALNTFLNRLRIIVNISFEEDSSQIWNILVYCSISHIQKPKSYWLVALEILKFQLYNHANTKIPAHFFTLSRIFSYLSIILWRSVEILCQ